jgi:rubrerythrin
MARQFNVFEVLRIAEEVERKAARFFRRAAERFTDDPRRSLYIGLATWRDRHEQAWARIRGEYSERTGQSGTFDPDDYVLSNPQVMAGLTSFGTDPASGGRPGGHESRTQILSDAVERARGVIVFYHGLKAFAGDAESRMMIDHMVCEEQRHVRLLTRSLDRIRAVPGGSNGTSLPFLSETGNPAP